VFNARQMTSLIHMTDNVRCKEKFLLKTFYLVVVISLDGKYLVLQGYSGSVYIIFAAIRVHYNCFGMLFKFLYTPLNPPYNDFDIL
jgi:hypothetical protein